MRGLRVLLCVVLAAVGFVWVSANQAGPVARVEAHENGVHVFAHILNRPLRGR